MPHGDDDWERVGEKLRARRVDLGFSTSRKKFLAERGWPAERTPRTIANIERGDQSGYDPETKILIEDVYGWVRGSIDRVLRGEEPLLVEDVRDELAVGADDERERLKALIQALRPSDFKRVRDFLVKVLAEDDENAAYH